MRGIRQGAVAALAAAMPFLLGSIDRSSFFEARLLAAHNRERTALGAPPLAWDRQLAGEAQSWAGELTRKRRFEHSHVGGEGENLWMGTATAYSPEEMIGAWIDEKRDYRSGVFPAVARSGNWARVGHYTQLIWGRTTRMGCAVASNGSADVLVCRYAAPGNVMGQRPI